MRNNPSPHPRWMERGLAVLLVLALLVSLLPVAASAATLAKAKCDHTYEVRRGDTLAKIGDRYGFNPNQVVYVNDWNAPYTIYVGQKICIPVKSQSGLSKLEAKYANAVAAYFVAGRSGDSILVYTYNYPKTSVLVKVDNASDSIKKFSDVGSINIGQTGNNKTWKFKLPASLKNAPQLTVCLKDRTTSYLQCVTPRRGS